MAYKADKKQIVYDKENNISLLFIFFLISAGVLMFAGLMAFDIKTVLIGVLLCHVFAPIVYCLSDEIRFNSKVKLFGKRIHLNSLLCLIGIIISFYQLITFIPPPRYLGNF